MFLLLFKEEISVKRWIKWEHVHHAIRRFLETILNSDALNVENKRSLDVLTAGKTKELIHAKNAILKALKVI